MKLINVMMFIVKTRSAIEILIKYLEKIKDYLKTI